MEIRIGTRGSKLALKQSEWIKNKIQDQRPDVRVELIIIKTTGDKILDSPLSKIGGKGLFVKEIEDALLQNRVDLAVHSMKDVPAELPEGLMLTAFPEREDPRDALLSTGNVSIDELPLKARLGTSSLRRAAQVLHIRPDLIIAPLRGNVDTRLGKLNGGELDCIILATAGLKRMGLEDRISQIIPTGTILPAIGQGALGLETRQDDEQTIGVIDFLNHEPTQIAVAAERAFLKKLQGGCQVPIAGLALLKNGRLHFTGMVAEMDGTRIIQDQIYGDPKDAVQMGETVAGKLLADGARKILEKVYSEALPTDENSASPPLKSGKVYLVGAGPGDPGLLTLKAKQCIQEAAVVIYDYLANPVFLEYASKKAEIIYVGKKGGDHTVSQENINALIIEKAVNGATVVRLKGGDPFIFGRGGEEAQELISAGVPFEVVPGVTSAISVPAYAGIPLTHRDHTATVAFVTGHEDPTKEKSNIHWDKLATAAGTLVFLMGVGNIAKIARKLIDCGRSPNTPAAVIRKGTMSDQKTLTGNLENIAERTRKAQIHPPAIIVVGDVVTLREELNWFETKPLFGKRIIVTRAREQASSFLKKMISLGAECIQFPTIQVIPPENWEALDKAIENLSIYEWILFTSPNGVKFFLERLHFHGKDVRELKGIKIGAIGPKTAEKWQRFGIVPDLIPKEYRAEAIVEEFKEMGIHPGKVLIPRAAKAREVLPEGLKKMGFKVNVVAAYQTVKPEQNTAMVAEMLRENKIDMVTFTSSSTVTNFLGMIDRHDRSLRNSLAGVTVACIGPVTAKTAEENGLDVALIPGEYTIDSLTDVILEYYGKRDRVSH